MGFWAENAWIPTLALILIVGGYFYYENRKKFWRSIGVKGVINFPIIGELYTLFMVDRLELEKYRLKYYDPEVIRQICVKDFDAFTNHQLNPWANKYQKLFLVWLQDDHWKRVRSLMSPAFTSGKIKRMFEFLQASSDDLVALFAEHLSKVSETDKTMKGVPVNIKEAFEMFSLDGIATCCYGLKLRRDNKQMNRKTSATRDEFVGNALKVFSPRYWRILLILSLPKSVLIALNFKMSPERDFEPLARRMNELIKKRQLEPKKYKDLLQSLVDANEGDRLELNEYDQIENHHAGLTHETLIEDQNKMLDSVKKSSPRGAGARLSELEILSEAMFMFMAGFETTSTLLTHCVICLAHHPKVQERLHEELLKIVEYKSDKNSHEFQYEALTSCDYLDAVISETLRMLPPAPATDRIPSRDYHIEKYNVLIPKGFPILLGLFAVQNDPDHWYKPEKFDPDRFMPGNKEKIVPGSYVPFSTGPRHCIGMRFSLTEAKIGLAKVIMKFRFKPTSGSKFPPATAVSLGLLSLKVKTVHVLKR